MEDLQGKNIKYIMGIYLLSLGQRAISLAGCGMKEGNGAIAYSVYWMRNFF